MFCYFQYICHIVMNSVSYPGGAAACDTGGAERSADRYEGAWPADTSVHTHREPQHLHKHNIGSCQCCHCYSTDYSIEMAAREQRHLKLECHLSF